MNKKLITILVLLLTGITLLTGCGLKKKENKKTNTDDEVKVNNNKDVVKDQQLDVFNFTNTSMVYQDGTSTLQTSVTNTSDKTAYLKEFKIHVKNADDSELVTLIGFIGRELAAGETKIITSSYGADITNSVKIEYEIIK